MKIEGFVRFLISVALVLHSGTIISQVPVEISGEKVIISGIPYYIHQVKKGQTLYSISRAYGVTVEELTKENPPALYGVKEGQMLRVPVREIKPASALPVPVTIQDKDESRYTYHILTPGQTVYSISKLYGVSENDIISSNPGIDINKLSVGSEIAVPRKEFMTIKQKFDVQVHDFFHHKVEKGETLASIANKYNISLRALRRENRNTRFPQEGEYIRIPGKKLAETEMPETVKADSIPAMAAEPVRFKRPEGFTPVNDLRGSINIAVLLPFYLSENSFRNDIDSSKIMKGKKQYKVTRKSDTWIYPRSLDFIEMYNGILLAADTLRSLGLNININTFDIKDDTIGVTRLIREGKLADMDLIIGPVYSRNLKIVSRYAKELGIPVVSPVPLLNNSVLHGNPNLFIANTSLELAQEALSKEISRDQHNNIVFIHADTSGNDQDVRRYKDLLFRELTNKMPFEDIRFKEFIFYSRSTFGNDSINRLSHALSERTGNSVIIASEDPAVISEVITIVHGLSRKYNVRIYGYPSIIFIENLEPKVLFDLDMLVYSYFWIDYSGMNVRRFNMRYLNKFLTMPLENSYAWTGYDIAYYFISGLAIHGSLLTEHPEVHKPELLQNSFDFGRKTISDGFENHRLFRIRYSRDFIVKLEE
jgi:LysM repeat protein